MDSRNRASIFGCPRRPCSAVTRSFCGLVWPGLAPPAGFEPATHGLGMVSDGVAGWSSVLLNGHVSAGQPRYRVSVSHRSARPRPGPYDAISSAFMARFVGRSDRLCDARSLDGSQESSSSSSSASSSTSTAKESRYSRRSSRSELPESGSTQNHQPPIFFPETARAAWVGVA